MNARLYSNGVCLDLGPCERDHKGGGKRARLNGRFSKASFRRLREFCVTHECPGECWGITLTIPGNAVVHWEYVRDYIHNLSVWCNGRGVPMIWRCELQRRGQPHLHLVVYSDARNCLLLFLEWQRLIQRTGRVLSVETVAKGVKDLCWVNRMFVNGSHHAFDLQRLSGDFRSWRYLVAHASKGKQAQEGWLGRQWGVVNRKSMIEDNGIAFYLDDKRMFMIRRWVRRLSRRRLSTWGRHFLLCSPDTINRMISFVQAIAD